MHRCLSFEELRDTCDTCKHNFNDADRYYIMRPDNMRYHWVCWNCFIDDNLVPL